MDKLGPQFFIPPIITAFFIFLYNPTGLTEKLGLNNREINIDSIIGSIVIIAALGFLISSITYAVLLIVHQCFLRRKKVSPFEHLFDPIKVLNVWIKLSDEKVTFAKDRVSRTWDFAILNANAVAATFLAPFGVWLILENPLNKTHIPWFLMLSAAIAIFILNGYKTGKRVMDMDLHVYKTKNLTKSGN